MKKRLRALSGRDVKSSSRDAPKVDLKISSDDVGKKSKGSRTTRNVDDGHASLSLQALAISPRSREGSSSIPFAPSPRVLRSLESAEAALARSHNTLAPHRAVSTHDELSSPRSPRMKMKQSMSSPSLQKLIPESVRSPAGRNVSSTSSATGFDTTGDGMSRIEIESAKWLNPQKLESPQNLLPTEGDPADRIVLRNKAINELITTEHQYLVDLELALQLRKMLLLNALLSEREISTIFSNMTVLVGFNRQLYEDMLAQADAGDVTVGQIFLKLVDGLKMYSLYCSNHQTASAALKEIRKSNSAFQKFLLEFEEPTGLVLSSFLIKPVQRICRYPMLLKEIKKYSEESSAEYASLCEAMQRLQAIVNAIDETAQMQERTEKLVEIMTSLNGGEKLGLLKPTRLLLREGTLMEPAELKGVRTNKAGVVVHTGRLKEVNYYLFNDVILRLKLKHHRDTSQKPTIRDSQFLSLQFVLVRKLPAEDNASTLEIVAMAEKAKFLCVCKSPQERDDWMGAIEAAVKKVKENFKESRVKAGTGSIFLAKSPRVIIK
mmetsp:Transcript_19293/g.49043  ORF Transcript_19293/g.49043 Transcript_19293/m.49043 type:complete len:549 (+) Transcript_19293:249-1895(+)